MRLVSRAAILLAAPLLFCCRMQEPKETQQLSRFVSVRLVSKNSLAWSAPSLFLRQRLFLLAMPLPLRKRKMD